MEKIRQILQQTIADLYKITDATIVLTTPESQFGDYASNVAMQLAGRLGKNPRDIATEIAQAIGQSDTIQKVEVAGPGFINFYLSGNYLIEQIKPEVPKTLAGQQFVVEYSCPNAFKELHAGHLYNTIAGDALSRLVEWAGASVARTNFGGDVGLHVGKAMHGIIEVLGGENPEKLAGIAEAERAQFLSKAYVVGAKAYEADDANKKQVEAHNQKVYEVQESQDHDSNFAKIYWTCRQWSYDYFDNFYERIEVDGFRYYPESICTAPGLEQVQKGLKAGVFKKSDGAVVYPESKSGLHTRVLITSQGLPTYETKDLGVIRLEYEDYHFDKRILITGSDQREYMKVIFSAAGELNPAVKSNMTHLTNGIVKFADGQKMSSRLGNVTTALDVVESVYKIVQKTGGNDANSIMLGAVKYEFLKHKLGGDISFDPEDSVSLQGNSGPYLQYAHARARNILNKVKVVNDVPKDIEFTAEERLLARKLGQYQKIIDQALQDYMIHNICSYLYELSQTFNRFYENSRVVGDEREAIRAFLVQKYADTLKNGLGILGINAPDKM